MGYVPNINHHGGNLTGVSLFNNSLGAKQLELLHQMVRANSIIAVLTNPQNPSTDLHVKDYEEAARKLGHEIRTASASNGADLAAAFADLAQHQITSVVVNDDAFFNAQQARIAELAARHSIAAITANREHVVAGALMSYGTNLPEAYRQCCIYAGKILKGEKPGDLPIIQPTKFEFVINMKSASSLGLSVPPALLVFADEIIE